MAKKDFSRALTDSRARPAAGRGGLGVFGENFDTLRQDLEEQAATVAVSEIRIERLKDNPFQYLSRGANDVALSEESLEELADSIRQNGFYGALLARQKADSQDYELAFGHRRRNAAQMAGLSTLPVKIMELSDAQMSDIMASENFSREDVSLSGQASIVGFFYDERNLSVEEVGKKIGRKRGWVETRLALYQSPDDVKQMVEKRPETLTYTRLLQRVSEPAMRADIISQILDGQLTRDQLQARLSNSIDKKITNSIPDGNGEENHNVATVSTANATLVTPLPTSPKPPALLKKMQKMVDELERVRKETGSEWSDNDLQEFTSLAARIITLMRKGG